jgi:hypothetical protein
MVSSGMEMVSLSNEEAFFGIGISCLYEERPVLYGEEPALLDGRSLLPDEIPP